MLIPLEKLSRKEMLRRGGGNLNEIIEFKRDENASIFQWHLTTTWRRSTLNCIRQVRVSRFCNRSARREFHSHYVWLLMCLESRASGTAAKVKTHKCLLREEENKTFPSRFFSSFDFEDFSKRSSLRSIKTNESKWNAKGIRKHVADLSLLFRVVPGFERKQIFIVSSLISNAIDT